ncbi:MAG: hypothetical protein AAGF72_05600 [Pseudomonadota bacterium]
MAKAIEYKSRAQSILDEIQAIHSSLANVGNDDAAEYLRHMEMLAAQWMNYFAVAAEAEDAGYPDLIDTTPGETTLQ